MFVSWRLRVSSIHEKSVLCYKITNIFFALNVYVAHLFSHSYLKLCAILCKCCCTVAPPITYICLSSGWSMGNAKNRFWRHEVAGDQVYSCYITGITLSRLTFLSRVFFNNMNRRDTILNPTSDMLFLMNMICQILCLLLLIFLDYIYFNRNYLFENYILQFVFVLSLVL